MSRWTRRKRLRCWFGIHEWGMYWNGRDGYQDRCNYCNKPRRTT